MRIVIATTEYAGVTEYSGGIGTQFAALAPALSAAGHEVRVITGGRTERTRVGLQGIDVHVARMPRRPEVRVPALAVAVDRVLRRWTPADVVLAPEFGAPAAAYVGRHGRSPVLTNLQTSLTQIMAISNWPLKRRVLPQVMIQATLERRQAKLSDAIVAPTTAMLNWAREIWPLLEMPAAIVPNTIDVAHVRALGSRNPPPVTSMVSPTVVFSGRLEPRKGVQVLAKAMLEVWEHEPTVRLILAGHDERSQRGYMSADVQRIVGRHAGRVSFLVALPPDRLFPLLATADVVALPSLWEAFGIAALEAMALRRALVVTSGHGFDDFVEPATNAEVVPPGQPQPLAAAITGLLRDKRRRDTLGATASRRADRYDSQTVANTLITQVQRLLGRV